MPLIYVYCVFSSWLGQSTSWLPLTLAPQAELTPCDSRVASGRTPDILTQRCQFLLSQGLAPSTRHVYLSAQHRYIDFCCWDGRLNSDGSFPPADEETLMCFASLLADNLTQASIKVYLSAVRSLHIEYGLSDPFVNCLRLQRLLRGIKWVQGPLSPQHLPMTLDHLPAIQHGLDFSRRDLVMLWVACCLGFFGFLWAGELTCKLIPWWILPVLKFISSALRLIRFTWAVIYMWGVVRARCVPSVPWSTSWLCVALLRVLSLLLVTVALLLGNSCHPQSSLSCTQLAILAPIQAIASVLGRQLQLLLGEFRIIWSRP